MNTNEDYIQEYIETRGLSEKSRTCLKSIIKKYCNHQQTNIHDLLLEADNEEEQGIRWKKRTLKKRLTNYMNYLKKEMDINSANTYFTVIKTFYNHHEIEIGNLPSWNKRNAKINNPITFKDLPDKEIIRTAVELSNPLMRSLILMLSSTGMAKIDLRNVTLQDFINSTQEYHQLKQAGIDEVVDKLLNLNDSISYLNFTIFFNVIID